MACPFGGLLVDGEAKVPEETMGSLVSGLEFNLNIGFRGILASGGNRVVEGNHHLYHSA
jgi:hypothetical protein